MIWAGKSQKVEVEVQ